MAVSYNRLFKLMIDKKMRKKDLCELAGGAGRDRFAGSH